MTGVLLLNEKYPFFWQAKEYIKLLGQFKELGFSEDKIQEALINSSLDENKTLDVLTSS